MSTWNLFKRAIVLALFCGALVSGSGCNTVKGAGKDIERGGEKLQGAADGANK